MENLREIKLYRDFIKEDLEKLDDRSFIDLYNSFLKLYLPGPDEYEPEPDEYDFIDLYDKYKVDYFGNLESKDDFIYLPELIEHLEGCDDYCVKYNDYLYDKEQDFYNDLEGFEKLPMVERLKILKNIKIIEQENQEYQEKRDRYRDRYRVKFFNSIRNKVENLLKYDFPEIYDLDVEQIDLIIEKLNSKQKLKNNKKIEPTSFLKTLENIKKRLMTKVKDKEKQQEKEKNINHGQKTR